MRAKYELRTIVLHSMDDHYLVHPLTYVGAMQFVECSTIQYSSVGFSSIVVDHIPGTE